MKLEKSASGSLGRRVCTFTYPMRIGPSTPTVKFDVKVPLDEFEDADEYVAHIISVNRILRPFRQELSEAFKAFIEMETEKYEDELGDQMVEDLLANSYENEDVTHWVHVFTSECGQQQADTASTSFSEQFQFVMRNSSHKRIEMIISMEKKLSAEMFSLIRARDFEMDLVMRECENAIGSSGKDDGLSANEEQLCRLNDRIRNLNNNYARQIQALSDRHRFEYKKLISSLFERDEFPPDAFNNFAGTFPIVKKSISAVANLGFAKPATTNRFEESFTIYLGAQLKTMHNARLLTSRRLTDLCRPAEPSDVSTMDTRRLHMNLSLYRRGLNGLLLLVDRNPYFHIHNRSEFAKICEQSTELHFDSLQKQLDDISQSVQDVNKNRFETTGHHVTGDYSLQVGDVYLTKHSNLASFQAIFHLVVEDNLETDDISSRHPCINGVRNVIRLSSKFGITTFSIPLLLVEKSNEKMTVAWCLKRAELVFKCVKGFMMEACAGNSTAGGGPPAAAVHYNVNFILPDDLAENVYSQIIEMFPTIFHLVPSVTV